MTDAIIDFNCHTTSCNKVLDTLPPFTREFFHSQGLFKECPFDLVICLFTINLENHSSHISLVHLVNGVMQDYYSIDNAACLGSVTGVLKYLR